MGGSSNAGARAGERLRAAGAWLLPRFALRVLLLVAVLFGAFAALDRLPGSAARALLGRNATDAAVARAEQRLGLDRPVPARFLDWLGSALAGDPGTTVHGRPIAGIIGERLPVTLVTSGAAFALIAVGSVCIGLWLHRRTRSGRGRIGDAATMALLALPEFVIGTFLIGVFSLGLGWLPAVTLTGADGGPAQPAMYVLPVVTLAIPQLAWNSRVVAAALADAEAMPHVRAARRAGIPEPRVLLRHILPPAAPVLAASVATTAGMLFAGTVAVETLFNHPGVGSLAAAALASRDLPLLVAVTALTGAIVLGLLTAADAVRTLATPGEAA